MKAAPGDMHVGMDGLALALLYLPMLPPPDLLLSDKGRGAAPSSFLAYGDMRQPVLLQSI
jgi:hypothetical protein